MKRSFVALTGASGILYGFGIIKALQKAGYEVHTAAANEALANAQAETGITYKNIEDMYKSNGIENIIIHNNNDLSASVSSGSFKVEHYIIAPASMGFVGRCANGISASLIERCADVALKERRPLVVLFREMPLSTIHLENLTRLSQSGAVIIPAAPSFYNKPETIDDLVNFVTGKVLDVLGIDNNCYKRWEN